MYAYIRGTIEAVFEDSIVVDNHGIGYRIFVPLSAKEELRAGEERKIHTFFSVREDAMQLFGFLSRDDLEIFRLLLGVSGIGPKGALGVLSIMSADDIRFAVLSDDAAGIAKAPGIGKKTAQKIILELKDKLNLEDAFERKAEHTRTAAADAAGSPENEAVLALVSLGYTNSEALRAVRAAAEAAPDSDTEALIKSALRELF